ncbi:EamA-like transporter family protein [Enhydrobacter aerosaccus]|uniref:EamA-like transporter family protein n=1 Tax=Enhydrobacter aerosaccus TaxID=225324 RepID=A0A1T4S1F6_9HYPH|nr:EamA family transporter [Enhydrobacter aerosaccus]SKA21651.1 EamA-like transporter family protein [Enhydrobacter aerosaccus]
MNLAFSNLIGLTCFTSMLAVGQLLFKKSGLAMRGLPFSHGLMTLAQLPAFYAALCLYGLSTILWVWLLSRITLMQAYPWVSAGVVIVPLLSGLIFGEKVNPAYWAGAALIIAGIAVTQYAMQG